MNSGFPCENVPLRRWRLLVAGCGYVGLAVARLAHAAGREVAALTRSESSARALAGERFPVLACDITDGAAVRALGRFDAVLHCASSGHGGAEAYRPVFVEGTRHLLEGLSPARYVLTGSTSVYAQTDGSWVDEESPAEPERETGRILREAEELALAAGGVVARLAGVYGPERWALRQKFLEGRAVLEDGGGRYLNQIHRADAASALLRLLEPEVPPGIYNVADCTPVTQREFYAALAARYGKLLPPEGPADRSRKRGWTHKRVRAAKLRALGWRPLFPSFRDAL